jgi:hypothetical protein
LDSEAPPLCRHLACSPEEIWQNQRPTRLGHTGQDEDLAYVNLLRQAKTTIVELMVRAMAGSVRGVVAGISLLLTILVLA